jgi:hypothetical protein
LNQDKWFKSISEGNISVRDQVYTLIATENKRQLISDNNILLGTKPYTIDNNNNKENKIINLKNLNKKKLYLLALCFFLS